MSYPRRPRACSAGTIRLVAAHRRGGGSNTSSFSPDGRSVTYTRLTPGAQPDCYVRPQVHPNPSNAYRAVLFVLGQQFDASKPSHEENVSFRTEGFRMISRGGCSLAKIETHRRQIFAPELARGGTQVCTIDVETGAVTELTPAVEGR